MSLIYCPECGHEISQAAIACPSCGRPINVTPAVEKRVVVAERPRDDGGFPPWAFIPIAILGIGVLFILFYAMSRGDQTANSSNLKVNISEQRASGSSLNDRRIEEPQTLNVPSGSTTVTSQPPSSQTVNVPGSQTSLPPTTGTVVIDAKVANRNGSALPVKNERFYLLDMDLDTILNEARIEPIEGQTLSNSFGMSVVYPDRYGDFNRQALAAIKSHIKYAGTTDGTGTAKLGGIEPESYYLFGVTKTGKGFALWNSQVNVRIGENILNLTPQPITEMQNTNG